MGKFLKILGTINQVMNLVEFGATAIKGKEKQEAAVILANIAIPAVTGLLTQDELKNSKIQEALRLYMDASIALTNAIKTETGKDLQLN
jgi:hypothetical protein